MNIHAVLMIEVSDWDETVEKTYKRPYNFQQQGGCQSRGIHKFTVPDDAMAEDFENEHVPEKVNHEEMGVSFSAWLKRDPKILLKGKGDTDNYSLNLWWERNFYPDFQTVANDLYSKGLLKKGEYLINIDW